MTLDLSTYSTEALSELQTRIEEEKKKREMKVPFEVFPQGDGGILLKRPLSNSVWYNLYHRLSAEAKLRAAGGKKFERKKNHYTLVRHESGDVWSMPSVHAIHGALYFDTPEKAEAAYDTLTPEERAAIFGFGEG